MPSIELHSCPQCGARFQKSRSWQKFCSSICRTNFHNEQKEQAMRVARAYGLLQTEHSWNKGS